MIVDQQQGQVGAPGVIDYLGTVFGVPPVGSASAPGLGGPLIPISQLTGNPGQGAGGRKIINLTGNNVDQQPSGV